MARFNVFNPVAVRSFISAATKGTFIYNHKQGWICNGYVLVKADHNALDVLRERLLVLNGDIVIKNGRLEDSKALDCDAIIPKDVTPAEITPFMHQSVLASRKVGGDMKRIFIDREGNKTAVKEEYAKLGNSALIEWHLGNMSQHQPPSVVGMFNGKPVLMILPVRMGWDRNDVAPDRHLHVIEYLLKKEKSPE